MRSPVTPSACTTAPAVSPPAMTRRRAPASTSPLAIAAKVASTSAPARSRPRRSCTAETRSGAAVADPRGLACRRAAASPRPAPPRRFPCLRLGGDGGPRRTTGARSRIWATWPRVAVEHEPEITTAGPSMRGKEPASPAEGSSPPRARKVRAAKRDPRAAGDQREIRRGRGADRLEGRDRRWASTTAWAAAAGAPAWRRRRAAIAAPLAPWATVAMLHERLTLARGSAPHGTRRSDRIAHRRRRVISPSPDSDNSTSPTNR